MNVVEQLAQKFKLPLPSKKDEAWKYTNPRPFLEAAWARALANPTAVDLSKIPFSKLFSQATLVFVDGQYRKDLSRENAGIKISATKTSSSKQNSSEFFEKMNLEMLEETFEVHLDSLGAPAPFVFLFVSTKSGKEFAANYRLNIYVPKDSKASIVESHFSEVEATSQVVTKVALESNSALTYVKVQNEGSSQSLNTTCFRLARDSRLESTQVTLGGKLTRNNLFIEFNAQGAEAIANGLYLACGTEHIDNRTLIDHAFGNTTSTQLYKGVLDDESHGVFTGGVHIRKDAQQANSSQLNNNLMLSQKAEIDTKPELEIEADDVKAAHGATIGQLNPDHLFYLQSRALSKKQAIEILASGFALDIVDRISDESIRNELSLLVKHKFSKFKVTV